MITGDAAHMDAHGSSISSTVSEDHLGGENIYSAEVEQAVYSHPAVLECAVIGVPDDGANRHAGPFAPRRVPKVRTSCVTGIIGAYKCPRSVSFTDQRCRFPGPVKS